MLKQEAAPGLIMDQRLGLSVLRRRPGPGQVEPGQVEPGQVGPGQVEPVSCPGRRLKETAS